jgi:uncharacterized protein (DUF433 family)
MAEADRMTRPHVTVDPAQNFGEPTINGVPVATLTGMIWAGDSVDFVAEDFDLTRPQVLVACWFQTRHGRFGRSRDDVAWKRAWKPWLDDNEEQFWHSRHGEIPDPPSRGAA